MNTLIVVRLNHSPRRMPDCAATRIIDSVPKKKTNKITIEKDKFRPRPRAPILPTKKFEDKSRRDERRAKHKKDPRRIEEE